MEAAKAALKQLWSSGKQSGDKTLQTALLFGAPGSGKTVLAHAFAGDAGLPIVVVRAAELLRQQHPHLMLRASFQVGLVRLMMHMRGPGCQHCKTAT